jgi:beta-lactamase class A
MQELTAQLDSISEQSPYEVRWHINDLQNGATTNRNGDDVIPSASTRKVAIMMTIFRGVSEGRWELDETIPITETYQDGNFIGAILDALSPGLELTLRDHMVMMITLSDNVSTGIIADKVGLDAVNDFCRDIGMSATTHRKGIPSNDPGTTRDPMSGNTTTANDQGLLLSKIVSGSRDEDVAEELGCTREQCQLALQIMNRQKYKNRLPDLLPPQSNVAHKTGTVVRAWSEDGVPTCEGYHDIGIVSNGDARVYTIAAFTNEVPEELDGGWPPRAHASHTIARINRVCWDFLVDDDTDPIDFEKSPYSIS